MMNCDELPRYCYASTTSMLTECTGLSFACDSSLISKIFLRYFHDISKIFLRYFHDISKIFLRYF